MKNKLNISIIFFFILYLWVHMNCFGVSCVWASFFDGKIVENGFPCLFLDLECF